MMVLDDLIKKGDILSVAELDDKEYVVVYMDKEALPEDTLVVSITLKQVK